MRICVSKLIRRLREQANAGDFAFSQRSVLLRLDRDGPATASALARAESVRPQSMRVTVASLEAMSAVRGRVMALRVGIALGCTPIGAPIVGWVADHPGPRWSLAVGAASGFAAALVAVYAIRRQMHLRHVDGRGEPDPR
ncbi:hypothetical protein ABW99_20940 [Pandoraea thiooxydans]|uniref:Uncharacterized protein n=1 Tax=Pandoraea thiooxydans TaxID=445709 RepID=A0A0U4E754_9BURK|nr:hypothetical protein ABW99_20940 [Pandoraea thiooxydans]